MVAHTLPQVVDRLEVEGSPAAVDTLVALEADNRLEVVDKEEVQGPPLWMSSIKHGSSYYYSFQQLYSAFRSLERSNQLKSYIQSFNLKSIDGGRPYFRLGGSTQNALNVILLVLL